MRYCIKIRYKMLRNCKKQQLDTLPLGEISKNDSENKVKIDIITNREYDKCMRTLFYNLLWLDNNVTLPGKNVKEEKT